MSNVRSGNLKLETLVKIKLQIFFLALCKFTSRQTAIVGEKKKLNTREATLKTNHSQHTRANFMLRFSGQQIQETRHLSQEV